MFTPGKLILDIWAGFINVQMSKPCLGLGLAHWARDPFGPIGKFWAGIHLGPLAHLGLGPILNALNVQMSTDWPL